MKRDRAQTEQALIKAVGRVLSRSGFTNVGVNTVAREAGVDKVLIYRYFGGLPQLLKAYGESGVFWPTIADILGDESEQLSTLSPGERLATVLTRLLDALRARPQTIEILAWETVQRNTLTVELEAVRETWSRELAERLLPDAGEYPIDLLGHANLLVAGMQYLLARSRTISVYGGMRLDSDAGWTRIRNIVADSCRSAMAVEQLKDRGE